MTNGPTNKDYIGKDLALKYRLKPLQFTKRQDYIYETLKTKYIARTNCSTLLWLHYVGEKRPPYTEVAFSRYSTKSTVVVEPTSSIVFHYRMPFENPVFRRNSRDIDDRSLQPFAKEIMKRVKTVWETIQ